MNNETYQILCFGDSITYGIGSPRNGWVDLLMQEYPDARIYPLGIPGENSSELCMRMELELVSRAHSKRRSVVTIAIGSNDMRYYLDTESFYVALSEYRDNLITCIDICQKHQAIPLLITPPPIVAESINALYPDQLYTEENVDQYLQVLEAVSQGKDIPLIDVYHPLHDHKRSILTEDGLHPNTQGYVAMYGIIRLALAHYL